MPFDKGASTTLPLRQRISSYAYDGTIAIVLRSKCRTCADAALGFALKPLRCISAGHWGSAAVYHQPLNKMNNDIIPVPVMQLAIMNRCLYTACLVLLLDVLEGT